MNPIPCFVLVSIVALHLFACGGAADDPSGDTGLPDTQAGDTAGDGGGDSVESADGADVDGPDVTLIAVTVTLDDAPVEGALVFQGGTAPELRTDPQGEAVVSVDFTRPGDAMIMASHPVARIRGVVVSQSTGSVVIALRTFDRTDNTDYTFQDPGEPDRRGSTAQCGHCHTSLNDQWFGSGHRGAASNPWVMSLFSGVVPESDEAACGAAGGTWGADIRPDQGGGRRSVCYLAGGLLDTLNPGCSPGADCGDKATAFGACADCHAPGVDGEVGGRSLLDATGFAFDYGIHCDVCHSVESVHLGDEAGVAGRLTLVRSNEASPSVALGDWMPLTFGPDHDVINPRMGLVQREHFRGPELCAGCHQLDSPVLVPGQTIDLERWPDGRLPIHSTFSEWRDGASDQDDGAEPDATCQSCHMPPAPELVNGAELVPPPGGRPGPVGGWVRPSINVRQHTWHAPTHKGEGAGVSLLELAAVLDVSLRRDGGALVATVTTSNASPAHNLPTGEPMRHLLLEVGASCRGAGLAPVGGDVVPAFGGFEDRRSGAQGFDAWPGAAVGDVLRFVDSPGGYYDYDGFGRFGDGTFDAEAKGMDIEVSVGARVITAVDAAGAVRLDGPTPDAALAYRVRPGMGGLAARAGAPGFGFARVLVGADGAAMVPHYKAVDVVSDNRLKPRGSFTTEHRFDGECESPEVVARLWYRSVPRGLALTRSWEAQDVLVAESRRMLPAELAGSPSPSPSPSPPRAPAVEGVVRVSLKAAPLSADASSGYAQYGYNDQSPGPVIRVPLGATLEVTLENALTTPTTIHWHGMHVPWEMDGATWMLSPVAPGATFVYRFVANQAGTFWYHPHFDTEQQVDGGLYGMLIVDDPAHAELSEVIDMPLVFDRERELGHARGPGHEYRLDSDSPPWRVNGALSPSLPIPAGGRVRGRILNASNGDYLALRSAGGSPSLRLIGGDQGILAAAEEVDLLVLAPGERAEVEWRVGQESLVVETMAYTIYGGLTHGAPAGVFTLVPQGEGSAPQPHDWGFSGASPSADPGYTDVVYTLSGSNRSGRWRMNGESFPDITPAEVALNTDAIIEVRNLSGTEHPFHLHGMAFEVLSVGDKEPAHRTVKDTINIPVLSRVRLRVVTDNPGQWMAHCHILSHAEDGMMTVLRVISDQP